MREREKKDRTNDAPGCIDFNTNPLLRTDGMFGPLERQDQGTVTYRLGLPAGRSPTVLNCSPVLAFWPLMMSGCDRGTTPTPRADSSRRQGPERMYQKRELERGLIRLSSSCTRSGLSTHAREERRLIVVVRCGGAMLRLVWLLRPKMVACVRKYCIVTGWKRSLTEWT